MTVPKIDLPKALFYTILMCFALVSAFLVGLYSGTNRNVIFDAAKYMVDSATLVLGEFSTMSGIHPKHFLQPSRHEGAGVTVNDPANDQADLILLSGFFENTNELRLIRRNGDLVARWPVSFSEIFPDTSHIRDRPAPATDWNIDIHGALALSDGSVVFNFEHGGLVKLDRCGAIVWTLPLQTHHSVEIAESGGFWVPGRRLVEGFDSPFPPFPTPLADDTLLRISEEGEIIREISAVKIFYSNGLETFLTANKDVERNNSEKGADDLEIVHLNKIAELTSEIANDFSAFEAGDLALSMRNMNMIIVVDPENAQIKWWRIGPWTRQHDPEFKAGGTIVVFNNRPFSGSSNVIEIDPISDRYQIIYEDSKMFTRRRGKVQIMANDELLITESDSGRVVQVNAKEEVVWEYINRFSAEEVAQINEARWYDEAYFAVQDWTCSQETR